MTTNEPNHNAIYVPSRHRGSDSSAAPSWPVLRAMSMASWPARGRRGNDIKIGLIVRGARSAPADRPLAAETNFKLWPWVCHADRPPVPLKTSARRTRPVTERRPKFVGSMPMKSHQECDLVILATLPIPSYHFEARERRKTSYGKPVASMPGIRKVLEMARSLTKGLHSCRPQRRYQNCYARRSAVKENNSLATS